MKHVGTKTIETTRLILRRLELTDAEMMFRNWTGDDKVTRFLRWDAHKTIDDTKNMIQQWVNNYQYDTTYYWGMYLKDGEMIGTIGITITSEYDFKGELGYKIGSRWWNQGYSSEAARAVIDYMFCNTDIERIDAFSSVENPASKKVMEKVGMHYEGLLRHYYKTRDGFHDCTLYGIIRNEWEQIMRSDIIKKYFQAWINKDIEIVKQTFSENALYSECYGPEYHGLSQIVKWFEDWNNRGQVLEWTIKRILEQNETLIVEWYFKCNYDGMVDGFDGVTIADFDDDMRIVKLCEFQSKAEHYYPYEA